MIDVVYIAGSGRSGSTLLERILGQTASFISVGELRHLWRADYETDLCGCGLTFQNCPFWRPILANIFADSASIQFEPILALRNQVDRMRYIPYMLLPGKTAVYRQRHARYTNIIEQIYRQVQTQYGNKYIIDSSKNISTLYLVAKMPSIKLHVIHMVRDSRAVAYSWQRKRVKPQVTKQIAYMPTYSPAYAAFDWAYHNSFVTWGKPLYDSYHFMRYEDLVQDSVTILNKLTGELGIPSIDWSFINQSTLRLSQTTHTASGNPMRFQSGALALKLDDVWKQEMSSRSKWIVTSLTWLWLRRYQYV